MVGPSDRKSWLLTDAYPTGRATGWRRTGCMVMLIVALLLIVAAVVAAVVA